MKYTINELKHSIYAGAYAVFDIFKNHFGEEFVDLQFINNAQEQLEDKFLCPSNIELENLPDTDLTEEEYNEAVLFASSWNPTILVWWPTVTVTNEHGASVVIRDLYAKIILTREGQIPYESHGFYLTRSTWPMNQWVSGYSHSHIMSVCRSRIGIFMSPCLGSGPIRQTIISLKTSCDEITWMLFCQELSVYVTVESLRGGPYIKLESIGAASPKREEEFDDCNYIGPALRAFIEKFGTSTLKDFYLYYIKHGHFSFCFSGRQFTVGNTYFDYMVDVSNCFIDYYNKKLAPSFKNKLFLLGSGIIHKYNVRNNKFYYPREIGADVSDCQNIHVCWFKGKDIKSKILEEPVSNTLTTLILDDDIAMYIYRNIIKSVNYYYVNKHSNTESNNSRDLTAQPSQRRYFL